MDYMIVILSLLVAMAACVAAWLVVPEVRRWLRLDSSSLGRIVKNSSQDSGISWPDALNKAVEEFKKLHPGMNIDIEERNTQGNIATVCVDVYDGKNKDPFWKFREYDSYKLEINKSGELLEIRQTVKAGRPVGRA